MTAVHEDTDPREQVTDETPGSNEGSDTAALASWPSRAGAFCLDVLLGLGVVATLLVVAWAAPQRQWLWWLCVIPAAVVLLAIAVNRLVLPTITGWTLGRALFGITVLRRDGSAPGPWRLLVRDLAHLLDTAVLFLGWLWPLWDTRHRTFADMLLRTEVRVRTPKPVRAKRFVVIAAVLGAVLAVAAATLGYLTIYRADLAVAQAREQLAVQGPKLVTEMLSYRKDNMQADFDRAKGNVTEGYWPQLQEQQESVKKSDAIDNEYWSPNSAVLEVSADRGTMLVLMQGQRGTPPDYWTITATVKAEFERVDGQWKVDGLTVLAKPQPAGGGR